MSKKPTGEKTKSSRTKNKLPIGDPANVGHPFNAAFGSKRRETDINMEAWFQRKFKTKAASAFEHYKNARKAGLNAQDARDFAIATVKHGSKDTVTANA